MSKLSVSIRAGLAFGGMTQGELSKKLAVSENTVSRWVLSKNLPDQNSLKKLQSCFGWSDNKLDLILEDWFENEQTGRKYHIAGPAYVRFRFDDDYVEFQKHLIEMDKRNMSGIPDEFEGSPIQWASIYKECPDTWRLLIFNNEIVGYWHFVPLKKPYFESLCKGELLDHQIKLEMINIPSDSGSYQLYFSVFVIDTLHRKPAAFSVLTNALVETLEEHASFGIFYDSVCAHSLSAIGHRLCVDFGMSPIGCAGGMSPTEVMRFQSNSKDILGGALRRSLRLRQAYLARESAA